MLFSDDKKILKKKRRILKQSKKIKENKIKE
jgi:hypothetical protein